MSNPAGLQHIYERLNVHVYVSDKTIARRMWPLFSPKAKTYPWRTRRHEMIRGVIDCHHKARSLACYVDRGLVR